MIKQESKLDIIYLIRHGETANSGQLYNLDHYSDGKPVDITEFGKSQMRKIANLITSRGSRITHLYASDQFRTTRSVIVLYEQLITNGSVVEDATITYMSELRDVDAAATMALVKARGGMSMETFKKLTGGNIYNNNNSRFEDPLSGSILQNETLESMRQRMLHAWSVILTDRKPDIAFQAVVLSHGDSLRALISGLENPQLLLTPDHYFQLTQQGYLEKGEALEVIINSQTRMISSCRLPDPNSIGRREKF